MSAPKVAMPMDLRSRSPLVTAPQPRRVPINPPSNDPMIPSRMVKMHPEGSRPGKMNFASDPAIRPSSNQKSHGAMTEDRDELGRLPAVVGP